MHPYIREITQERREKTTSEADQPQPETSKTRFAPADAERIDEDRLATHIPEYRRIIGFRNIIAHGYDVIDDVPLWDLVTNRIPEFKEQIATYLTDIQS
jgi:uncharacterized protein YutE (UPF0331/DUF86 family)